MKVLWVADPNSIHTRRWVQALAHRGVKVCLLGLTACAPPPLDDGRNVEVHSLGYPRSLRDSGSVVKLAACVRAAGRLRALVRRFRPDLVHAHYASSHGLIGTLGGFRPYVLSVWGSDILVFPAGSRLRRLLIKYNLGRANLILTTSMAMAREARRYTSGRVEVTPFGVDVDRFRPGTAERRLFRPDDVVVGTVKALYPEYGVDSLIEAFRIVRARRPGVRLKLLIVGGGPQERALKGAIRERGLEGDTLFSGHVDYDAVPDYYRALTVYVALSQTEGFGVSIAEACASGKPVVVSAAGGLPEVVDDGVTGFVVPVGDVERAAHAIERLVVDERLREAMGRAGRQRVERLYDWKDSIERMLRVYGDVLSDRSRGAALETR